MSPIIAAVNEEATAGLSERELRTFKRLIVRVQRTLDAKAGTVVAGPLGVRGDWPKKSGYRKAD